jgi:hypothetical protein
MLKKLFFLIAVFFLIISSAILGLKYVTPADTKTPFLKQNPVQAVLAAATEAPHFIFKVNVPSFFNENTEFAKDVDIKGGLTVQGKAVFNSGINLNNNNLDLGTGTITASNILYGLKAGNGVTISSGQNPTIAVTNTGVSSLQSQTGDLTLTAGSGISIDGLKISATTSNTTQNIFKTISDGSNSFSAGSDSDTLTLTAGTGMTITTDTSNKKLTFSTTSGSSGVTGSGFTTNGIMYATGNSAITSLAPGTSGYVLQSNGISSIPSWVSASSVGTNYWQLNSGILSPATITNTLAIGATTGLANSGLDIEQNGLGNAIFIANQKGSGDILTASTSGTAKFTIANDGTMIIGTDGAPIATTIRGGVSSGNSVAGANLTIDASNGTGTAGSGDLIFRTAQGSDTTLSFDNASSTSTTSQVSSLTWSHTTTTANNRLLVVGITETWDESVTSVTYAGSSLTKIDTSTCAGSSCKTELWYIKNPNSGANNVVVTFSFAENNVAAGATSFYNVDQTTPIGTSSTNNGNGSPSTTITTTSTQKVFDVIAINTSQSWTPGTGQTQSYNTTAATMLAAASYKQGATGSTTTSWSDGGAGAANWAQIAIPINQISNSSPDTLVDRLHITASGSIGIGTAAPIGSTGLEIQKNSLGNATLVVDNSGGAGDLFTASSSGTAKFVIDKSGNVGIGTSTPTSELYVNGSANDMVVMNSSLDAGFIRPFEMLDSSMTTGHNLVYHVGHDLGTNDTAYFGFNYQGANSANNFITLGMYGADNLVNINANGDLGIGTQTPKNKLDVAGGAAIGSYAGSNTAPSNSLIVSGNIGIGNNNPSNALDVNGSANDMVVLTSTLSTSFIRPLEMLDSSMTTGQNLVYHVGHDLSNNNTAYIGFHYSGTGSPENWLTMGFWGTDNVYNFTPSGHVGFGTTAMGNGALVVNQQSSAGNIFSASQSGTTLFNIDNSGNTRIVASLCVKATFTTACAGSTAGTIYATNTTVQSADVAENYVSSQTLEPGDVIMPAADGDNQAVIKTTSAYQTQTIGIVSTKPGVTLNSDAQTDATHPNLYPIALQGRVPVKVSTTNGQIHTGDLLTASNIPGVAMKATNQGQIIGKALEDDTNINTNSVDKIMVFVNISWANPNLQIALTNNGDLSLNGQPIKTTAADTNTTTPQLNTTDGIAQIQNQIASLSAQIGQINDLSKQLAEMQKTLNINQTLQASKSAGWGLSSENTILQGNLTIAGRTTLTDLGITGRITDGLLSINGLDDATGTPSATINTLSAPLKIQSLAINGVDFENGKLIIDTNGNLTVNANITANSITTDKLNITTDKTATDSGVLNASTGSISLEAGQTNIDVQTTALTSKSLIFLTPNLPVAVGYKLKNNNTFNIYLQEALKQNLKVNWWIIN